MEDTMKYKTRKDKRNKKTGGKSISSRCQNNGDCPYCTSNRTIKTIKRFEQIKFIENERSN